MIVRMLDPDQICGTNVESTVSLRQTCIRASIRFGNIASELFCTWHTALIDTKIWVPPTWEEDGEALRSFVPFRHPHWMPETPGDLGQVSRDKEGHVLCNDHTPYQPAQGCPWCQYRRRSFVDQAKEMSPDYDKPDAFATIVYEPLQAPTLSLRIDKEGWGSQVEHGRPPKSQGPVWSPSEMASRTLLLPHAPSQS